MLLKPVALLPEFPTFKSLELSDRLAVEQHNARFAPYSDFNFVSLYSYDVNGTTELSALGGNLVVKLADYVTSAPFFSFLGDHDPVGTVSTLLEHARRQGIVEELKLVPDMPADARAQVGQRFDVEEDPDNFDYILSAPELSELKGGKFGAKRNFVNRFVARQPDHAVVDIDLRDPAIQQQIDTLFEKWGRLKNAPEGTTVNEVTAIRRLMRSADHFPNLAPIGLYIAGELAGFSIDEVVHGEHGLIHFEKADNTYVGCYQFLKMSTARRFAARGRIFINYEQDLGIPGLRKAKRQWQPVSSLKKLRIRPRRA